MTKRSHILSHRSLPERWGHRLLQTSQAGILAVFLFASGPVKAQLCEPGVIEAPVIGTVLKGKVAEVSTAFDAAQTALGFLLDRAGAVLVLATGEAAQAARENTTQLVTNGRMERLADAEKEAARTYQPSVELCRLATRFRHMSLRSAISTGVKQAMRIRASQFGGIATKFGEVPAQLALASSTIKKWGDEKELNSLGVTVVPPGSVRKEDVNRDIHFPDALTMDQSTSDGSKALEAAADYKLHVFSPIEACARGAEHLSQAGLLKDRECRSHQARVSLLQEPYDEYLSRRTIVKADATVLQAQLQAQKIVYQGQGLPVPAGLVSQTQFEHDILSTPTFSQFKSLVEDAGPQLERRMVVKENMALALAAREYDQEVIATLIAGANLATALQDRHDRREAAGLSAASIPFGKGGG